MPRSLRFYALSIIVAAGVIGCGGGGGGGTPSPPTTPTTPSYTVSDFITGVKGVNGGDAVQGTTIPAASGSLSLTPTTSAGVINGGSRVVRLHSSTAISTVYVTVKNVDRPLTGAWVLTVAGGATDTYIIATFSRNIPVTTFTMSVVAATAGGQVSAPSDIATNVLNAATGDVQVSVSWDTASDVDLHVIEPNGEHIYWAHETSASGGRLDLDSNAGCTIDNVNNENIRWTTAPSGTYTVAVDYWSSCGVASTQYVVTVNNGGSQGVYTGTFTGSDTDEPRVITTFTRGGALLQNTSTPLSHLRALAERTMRHKRGR